MVTEVLFFSLVILFVMNVPIAICIGLASFLALYVNSTIPMIVIAQRMFTSIDSFTLLAIPLFMIAGRLMEHGGISKRLINLSSNVVGGFWGGLGQVGVLACMLFASMTGSAPATVVAIGSIMIPAMIAEGYDKAFSVALLASAGIIGVILPPSILFVTYGVTFSASIGRLFVAGIIPGITMGLSLMLVCYIVARKRGWKGSTQPSLNGFLKSFRDSIWGLLMPVVILGGIYSGLFTPTESAAVACIYSIIVGVFIYKELSFKNFITSLYEAGTTSAMVLFIIATANVMSWVMTTEAIPIRIATAITNFADTPGMLLLTLNLVLLAIGCFMEPNSAIIILGPILMPILQQMGIDLIHFGVIMVVNLAISMITPPLCVNLFVGQSIQKNVPIKDIVLAAIPMFLILVVNLFLFTYFPSISLFFLN